MFTISRSKIIFSILLFSTLIYSILFIVNVTANPTFHATVTLSEISEAELTESIQQEFIQENNLTTDKLRKLEVNVDVEKNWLMNSIEITIPNLVMEVDQYDGKIRSYRAGYHQGENTAYHYVLFKYEDLSKHELKEILQNQLIQIEWIENGEKQLHEINISNLLD
ncbi:hypothetical protein [Ornithinibacillus californiensis]|uniref:hypothetical protein n=1 Tax=Ornithinibacillus californiensis TaxID=161536 RepID=UPI00064D9954|nr:hypothetical protein [Ornithinibacillus californiensis]